MKFKRTVFLTAVVVAMGLALGASTTPAAEVIFENGTQKAIRIENLNVGGKFYNVAFTSTGTVAAMVYGIFPGIFDFTLASTAVDAVNAVNKELNKAGATGVGAEGSVAVPFFWVGFDSERGVDPPIEVVIILEALYGELWVLPSGDAGSQLYNFGTGVWADFTAVDTECTADEDCDDDLFCNGQETCVDGECQGGTNPCEEGEICNEETGSCEAESQLCGCDLDGNGVCDMLDWFLFGEDWGRTDCPIQ